MANFVRAGQPHFYVGLSTDTKPGPTTTVTTLAEVLDNSETGVDVTDGTLFTPAETVIVESEEMRIESISVNTLTVIRGVNGTLAAAHANGLAVSRKQNIPRGSRAYETNTGDWYITFDGGTTWVIYKVMGVFDG